MAGSEVTTYANELRLGLAALGVGAEPLNQLVDAAQGIADAYARPPATMPVAEWNEVKDAWEAARDTVSQFLTKVLLGALADVPALAELAGDAGAIARSGINGAVTVGPVRLSVASSTLVIQPPTLAGGVVPEPLAIGPYPIGQIAASLSSPFGGGKGMPGGGSIVRLPEDKGYGGTLELPLGPVQVSAAAILSLLDGQPSFLAVIGATFTPPIQLSFGFSLDRVGGIIGVNRRADVDALTAAVRTGTAGDVLFSARPPSSPLALVTAADRLFPRNIGTHLVGPSLRISWLSFGEAGSLLSLDLGVVVEIPTGRVVILGVARVSIPGLSFVLSLRLDLLGVIDPVEQLISIDASLVDSHVLGIFEVYGDAAMRVSWGTSAYTIVSVGGFFPGFNPEPARIPAMRRVGLSLDMPIPIIEIKAEGYFAITSNSIQFGGRWEVGISLGIEAHGFLQVDAIVQFRPFRFEARVAAGFEVSAGGFTFASVTLEGSIAGPGPIVIRGSLSIDVFLFSISWDETFTIGDGPADVVPSGPRLLEVIAAEFAEPANIHAGSIADPDVVLSPRPGRATVAAVPATGSLKIEQRRAPLGLVIERVDGRPLDGPQGVRVVTPGVDAKERFSPGSYVNLTDAEAMNRPPFDLLPSGRTLSLPDPGLLTFPHTTDTRKVRQIVIRSKVRLTAVDGLHVDLGDMAALTGAARQPPALSNASAVIEAAQEVWAAPVSGGKEVFASATAAHQYARYSSTVAMPLTDLDAPVQLAGVL
jgi:hypothetical protein